MTQIQIGSDLSYQVNGTTVFLFQICAANTQHQRVISEALNFNPLLNVEHCHVGLDGIRMQRILVEPCELHVSYRATVEMTPGIERPTEVGECSAAQLPAEILPYLNPSRYCESDLLGRFAFEEFGQLPRGFQRVKAICDWVFNHLEYTPGSTMATTTASDVLLQRTGVCRDYAHLAITLCRGVGIPARYVSGYAVDLQPPDFHGFIEAYLDGQWFLLDPTRLVSVQGLVRIGAGRDAADVAFSTITGDARFKSKSVWANSMNEPPGYGQDEDNAAVSLA